MAASAPVPSRRRGRARDVGWLVFAGVVAFLFLLVAVEAVIALFERDWTSVVGAPVTLLLFFWIAGGAWRRTRWGARSYTPQSPRPFDSRAFALFLPNGYTSYARRPGADVIVGLRSVAIVLSVVLVACGTTLATIPDLPSGPVVPWLPIFVAVAAAACFGSRCATARPIDCSSDITLAASYVPIFCLRMTFAMSIGLFAFTFAIVGGPVWIFVPGAAFALGRLWIEAVPNGRTLPRDQRLLSKRGCERDLVEALHRVPGESP